MRFQADSCSGVVKTRAAGRDAALRRHAGHLGEDEAGAAFGALGEVHEMPIGRRAFDGAVLRHRRDDDAVLELKITQPEGREHRRPRTAAVAAGRLRLEPYFRACEPCLVALRADSRG